jgi:hypothetical protein
MPPELFELLQRLEAEGKLVYTMTAINQPTGIDDEGQPVWPAVASFSLQVHPKGSKMYGDLEFAKRAGEDEDGDELPDCISCEGDGFVHGLVEDEMCQDCQGTGKR